MARVKPRLARIKHVELRVRDLRESTAFYKELLGLERVSATPPSEKACICRPPSGNDEAPFELILTEGFPEGMVVAGVDHISLEAPSREDVDRVFAKARQQSIRATAPRIRGGCYQTLVFDPDGYKIQVAVASADEAPANG